MHTGTIAVASKEPREKLDRSSEMQECPNWQYAQLVAVAIFPAITLAIHETTGIRA